MRKFRGFWLAALALLLCVGNAYALSLETGQPMVAEQGAQESPSQIKFVVTTQDDYQTTALADNYYTYVYLMDGVVLAKSIGNAAAGSAIAQYEAGTITAAQAKALYVTNPDLQDEDGVAAATTTNRLVVDQLGNYAGPAATDFGIWGLKGSNWLVVRIPGATNTVTADAAQQLIFTIRNLCIDLSSSPLTTDDLVQVVAASPEMNNPLDHYPNSFDRDDTIAAYPTAPSAIAIIGEQSSYNVSITACAKDLGNYYSSTTEIEDCDFDAEQDSCMTYTKCFVLNRLEDSQSLLGGTNRIKLDPSTGVYIPSNSTSVMFMGLRSGESTWTSLPATAVSTSYTGTCTTTRANNWQTYEIETGTTNYRKLAVIVNYQVNTGLVDAGDQLTMDVSLVSNAQRSCGANTYTGAVNLATMVACDDGTSLSYSAYFPYVYYGIEGWNAALAISNLDSGTEEWNVTLELVAADGTVATLEKTAVAGKQWVFQLDDIIADFTGTTLTSGTGYLRIKSNRSVNAFAYYQGPDMGAGVNAVVTSSSN